MTRAHAPRRPLELTRPRTDLAPDLNLLLQEPAGTAAADADLDLDLDFDLDDDLLGSQAASGQLATCASLLHTPRHHVLGLGPRDPCPVILKDLARGRTSTDVGVLSVIAARRESAGATDGGGRGRRGVMMVSSDEDDSGED